MDLYVERAKHILEESKGKSKEIDSLLKESIQNNIEIEIPSTGLRLKVPSKSFSTSILNAASQANTLLNVSTDVDTLVEKISQSNDASMRSIAPVIEFDEKRAVLQSVLDRVENLLEMRECLKGLEEVYRSPDILTSATFIKRFRAVSRELPIPDSDLQYVNKIEENLTERVSQIFDEALDAQQNLDSCPQAQRANLQQSITEKIQLSSQITALLGRIEVGMKRYCLFLRNYLHSECLQDLLLVSERGIEPKMMLVNALSSNFGRVAATLDDPNLSFFSSEYETIHARLLSFFTLPGANTPEKLQEVLSGMKSFGAPSKSASQLIYPEIVLTVFSISSKWASKLLLSFLGGQRMRAALLASNRLRSLSGSLQKTRESMEKQEEAMFTDVPPLSVSAAAELAAQVQDVSNRTPLLPKHIPEPEDPRFPYILAGTDYSHPSIFDAFLNEVALVIQRCVSLERLLYHRMGLDATVMLNSPSDSLSLTQTSTQSPPGSNAGTNGKTVPVGLVELVERLSPALRASVERAVFGDIEKYAISNDPTYHPESSMRSGASARTFISPEFSAPFSPFPAFQNGLDNIQRLYCQLQGALVQSQCARALAVDLLLPEGASSASVDLTSLSYLPLLTSRSHSLTGAAAMPVAPSLGLVAVSSAVGGVLMPSAVEDCFFLLRGVLERSLSTGSSALLRHAVDSVHWVLHDLLLAGLAHAARLLGSESAAAAVLSPRRAALPLLNKNLTIHAVAGEFDSAAASVHEDWGSSLAAEAATFLGLAPIQTHSPPAPRASLVGSFDERFASFQQQLGSETAFPSKNGTNNQDRRTLGELGGLGLGAVGLHACTVFLQSLLDLANQECQLIFGVSLPTPSGGGSTQESVLEALQQLQALLQAQHEALHQILAALSKVISLKARHALTILDGASSSLSYDITEAQFLRLSSSSLSSSPGLSGQDSNPENPFETDFVLVIQRAMTQLRFLLTPALFAALGALAAAHIRDLLVAKLRKKKFSQFGAIKLAADLRILGNLFSEWSPARAARDAAASLLQFSRLVNLDSPAELLEYDIDSEFPSFRKDIQAILKLRLDFDPAEIDLLKI